MRRVIERMQAIWELDDTLQAIVIGLTISGGGVFVIIYGNELITQLSGPVWLWVTAVVGAIPITCAVCWLGLWTLKILGCTLILGIKGFIVLKPRLDKIWRQKGIIRGLALLLATPVWGLVAILIYGYPDLRFDVPLVVGAIVLVASVSLAAAVAYGFFWLITYLLCLFWLIPKRAKKVAC